ncbi:OmpH family outer membrane protein [bacterium]|nr:OmpH family outer membrane protein [bacterium]
MKRLVLSALIIAGIAVSNAVMAEGKIAVIDVQAVVSKSAQVQALKKEQQTKVQELEKWVKNCKADVDKQQTQAGKEKLAKKYDAELAKKQEAIAKNYKEKLQAIDKSITETITTQARAKGYDMVISKGVVIYGGDDITAEIQKVVK